MTIEIKNLNKKYNNFLAVKNINWNDAGTIFIAPGHQINKPAHLFEKIEDEKIEEQRKKLKGE